MKKLFLTLFAGALVGAASAQSTAGLTAVFEDNFKNNKNGWETSMSGDNRSRLNNDEEFLIVGINTKGGSEKASVYTRVDFNKNFVLKASIKSEPKDKTAEAGSEYGIMFGYSTFKYRKEQGWYGYRLKADEKKAWMNAFNSNGTQLFNREQTGISYNPNDYNEIGIERKDGKIIFYLNGKEIYRNDATEVGGGAITFYANGVQRAYLRSLTIHQDTKPTAEEAAKQAAIDKAISDEEEDLIAKTVANLEFATGKADIKPTSLPALNQMAEMMIKNTKFKVILKGHTDSVGNEDANMKLSQARVDSVIKYLVEKGISKDRLVGLGYGDKQPIATNDTEEGRQRNRRVEFEIIL
jgi:outer membrane protein OmpA-like peptidoglycan-associated protein